MTDVQVADLPLLVVHRTSIRFLEITVNIFNTAYRYFLRGAKELKEEEGGSKIFSTTNGGLLKN